MDLPDGEFDIMAERKLTRKQTKDIKRNRKEFVFLPTSVSFSYLDFEREIYSMNFRVVRFKITDDTYECLITNIREKKLSSGDLKSVYSLRWGEECAFRDLKYSIGAVHFHSRKQSGIRQEIYAALILFNFTQAVINKISLAQKEDNKYCYAISFSAAVTNIRLYLNGRINTKEMILRIKKFLIPVRPGRKYERHIKPQSSKMFIYRAS